MPASEGVRKRLIPAVLISLPVTAAALMAAPGVPQGIPGMLKAFSESLSSGRIVWSAYSLRTAVLFLLTEVCIIMASSDRGTRMRGEEHGSAKWGDPDELNRRYRSASCADAVLTDRVSMGLDASRHGRNLNTLVVGGSGAGKTRNYVKPNILNLASSPEGRDVSMVILDPKGELVRSTAPFLMSRGYKVKILDLIHMERSLCYNPFVYLRDDNDIQKLVSNIMMNTSEGSSKSSDPFWDRAASMLLLSLIMYLHAFAPPEEQNFSMVLEMIRSGEVREDNDDYESPLDILFARKEMELPDHPSVRIYRNYRSGSARTLKSIQITLLSRLEKFDLESLAGITCTDEMEISELGERKTALFAVISDNDPSFNFIVGMLYTQLFQELYYRADVIHAGSLPVHVRFLMDEFATVSIPQDFDRILSTMRSREISVAIIIQNMTQLRALFDKQWESIVGNCDELLYLGGNEQSTHEFVSKMLGSSTIETESFSRTKGRGGSMSVNTGSIARSLMTPDEVRMMDNRYAVLFIRGERPVKDLKYRIMRHPLISETSDGGAPPYIHGEDRLSAATVTFRDIGPGEKPDVRGERSDILILTEDEIYALMTKKGMFAEKENKEEMQ